MRNASALDWVLLVALLGSYSSEPPSRNSSLGATAIDGQQGTAHAGGAEGLPGAPVAAPALLRFGHGYMPNGMWNGGVRSILEGSKGNYLVRNCARGRR